MKNLTFIISILLIAGCSYYKMTVIKGKNLKYVTFGISGEEMTINRIIKVNSCEKK